MNQLGSFFLLTASQNLANRPHIPPVLFGYLQEFAPCLADFWTVWHRVQKK